VCEERIFQAAQMRGRGTKVLWCSSDGGGCPSVSVSSLIILLHASMSHYDIKSPP
jgi:hypothetical protein